ncbi:TPA: polysaccharide pyruvyl transferase family protein [Streptococcus suis]|uniref:polysaccharide pyruvyl transferase family protein n=1 Tax=Streptococcus suis TaxID=1307 RepID=UPI001553E878|nr:polysaccharide pyruvyl transferase family protein [Streptococcus suis]MCK4000356.1 polysaccharide pyruvyl transferase family protein [Streptococcus suis]MCK4060422.1 polysaccharide pyruvyl transferase family protein [Streptococcus suis]MDX5022374.1 polysaccharide pyruvyl transferase family protein [Streptococcus suis]NQJ36769.1 polysaccharide pyruvyl transferase family protein [Streptococcus suis]NQJ42690.1 polysaccharide pyruvyl transferase family protein [Streptococcus suis]
MKRILLINQFNSDNLGDKLLSNMISEYLEKKNFTVDKVGYALEKEQQIVYNDTQKLSSYRAFKNRVPNFIKFHLQFKRNLKRMVSRIDLTNYSGIIIGGGQLIKHKTVFSYCFRFWSGIAQKNNIPLFIYGVGVDSGLSEKEIKRYSKGIDYASFINCRDLESKELFRELFHVDAVITPDVAFGLSVNRIEKEKLMIVMPYNFETAKYSFDYEMTEEDYYADLFAKVKEYSLKNYKIVLSSTTTSDARTSLSFKVYLEKRGIEAVIYEAKAIDDLIQLFSRSEIILTGRMHAMIMGLCTDNKIIPILVSDKIRVFEQEYLNGDYDYEQIKKQSNQGLEQLINALQVEK